MLFDYEDIYEQGYLDAYRDNVKDAPRAARAGELDKKIESFCKLHGLKKTELIQEIEQNEIVAACFAKNPNKQRYHEIVAAKFVKSLRGVRNFFGPDDGPKKVIVNGAVMNASEFSKAGGSLEVKTIDFRWEYMGRNFFASHKYTKESGGSQDHQYEELQRFIKSANMCTIKNTYFIAIADGRYYEGNQGRGKKTKMMRLKELTTEHTYACTIVELHDLMVKICKKH